MRLFLYVAVLLTITDELWADEICCPGLRCYNNNPPFNDRPLPECPNTFKINMTLYTRQNPTNGETITRDTIPSSFKDNVTTMFIAHGWEQVQNNQWMVDIKDAFLEQGDCNVIIVIWRGCNEHLNYPRCASNTRTVGGEIALVANNTINKGKSSRVCMHCIGHSLGAHVCGHAGQQGQYGRITGLDPAGPFFEQYDWSVGLNPSCADLVDVIHTNGELIPETGSGMMKAIGHIDFYPNGGRSQPGCVLNQYGKAAPIVEDFVTCENETETCIFDAMIACSHFRAVYLFTESIRTPCLLSRFNCSDPANIPASCTENIDAVQSMGFNANKYPGRGIFYLKTKACKPFCCKEAPNLI